MKKFLFPACLTIFLLLLLFIPQPALEGARYGLALWMDSVVPTLLPFMILSGVLMKGGLVRSLMRFFAPAGRLLFGIDSYGTYSLLAGFFCGYPMGAKTIADLRRQDLLGHAQAAYLLNFCNNVSPAFVITFLVLQNMNAPQLTGPVLVIIFGAPIIYGIISGVKYRPLMKKDIRNTKEKASPVRIDFGLIDACILDSVITVTKLGAYIIMFSIIARLIREVPFLSQAWASSIVGITEVTTGIQAVSETFTGNILCIPALSAVTSFGGLSALAQTESMLHGTDLRILPYLVSKIIISALAFTLALIFVLV